MEATPIAQWDPAQAGKHAQLLNGIEDLEHEMQQPFKRVLTEVDKLTIDGAHNSCNKREADIVKSHGQMFSVIFGQTSNKTVPT
jgi:hypothetical protein